MWPRRRSTRAPPSHRRPAHARRSNTTPMGWERRGRGGLYYTRSRRVNGRIVQEYVGTGLVAELAPRLDAEERGGRRARMEAARGQRRRLDEADGPIRPVCGVAGVPGG